MQLPSPLREPIQKQLSKYILRSKVKATDVSSDWTLFGVAGKDAAALVQRAVGDVPRGVHDVINTKDAMVIRLPGDRYEIVAAREKSPDIIESLSDAAEKADPDYWDWLDIRAGIPVVLPATQEAFVPQMVNLDLIGGVSLTKGLLSGTGNRRAHAFQGDAQAAHVSRQCRRKRSPPAGRESLQFRLRRAGLRKDRQRRPLARGRLRRAGSDPDRQRRAWRCALEIPGWAGPEVVTVALRVFDRSFLPTTPSPWRVPVMPAALGARPARRLPSPRSIHEHRNFKRDCVNGTYPPLDQAFVHGIRGRDRRDLRESSIRSGTSCGSRTSR